MKSLGLKLSLAFLFVSLIGILLVTGILNGIIRNRFDRFILEQDTTYFVGLFTETYQENDGWDDLTTLSQQLSEDLIHRQRFVLLDEDGTPLLIRPNNWDYLNTAETESVPITIQNEPVATLM